MALTNPFSSPGSMTEKTYADFIDKAMDMIFDSGDSIQPALREFFEKVTSKTGTFKISSVSGTVDLPMVSEDGTGVPMTQPAPGLDDTFTTVQYRRGVEITRQMVERDLSGKINVILGGLPRSYERLMEYGFAKVLNNAFATTTLADGMYLCDTDHPNHDAASGTWDNLTTAAALAHGTLSDLRVLMRKATNEKGFPDAVKPTAMVTVPDLEETAKRLLLTTALPGTALNDINWNKEAVRLVISDWLTSTTAYFLIGDKQGEARGLLYVEEQPPSVVPFDREDPDIIRGQRIRGSFTTGAISGRNTFGNSGA